MENAKKISHSDDEEDLEALRLAALQSLKRKNAAAAANGATLNVNNFPVNHENHARFIRAKGMVNKRGRFYGAHQGRGNKNGQFNNRVRNTNLISITTIPTEDTMNDVKNSDSGGKLTLPQDRYCGKTDLKEEKTTSEPSSKFSRYNDSDKSDSESDEDKSECTSSPKKMERCNSLEALMQELDNEILGEAKEEKLKRNAAAKAKKLKKLRSNSESVSDSCEANVPQNSTSEIVPSEPEVNSTENFVKDETLEAPVKQVEVRNNLSPPQSKKTRLRSPIHRKNSPPKRKKRIYHQNLPISKQFTPAPFNPTHFPPNFDPGLTYHPPFNPLYAPPNPVCQTQIPPPFTPFDPLNININPSDNLPRLAPLSPRSAAFVLQNRAIIERRKRSPRRSYSRSPSPQRRRSRSPPRRSLSPRRKSRSPRRKSLSPPPRKILAVPTVKKEGTSPRNKPSIRERLGLIKGASSPEQSLVATAANVKDKLDVVNSSSPDKDEIELNPVLEARKRKFESNEIKVKEGVIRLNPKPKDDEKPLEETKESQTEGADDLDELSEDVLLDGDYELDLEAKVDDIFSDEDSEDDDNEGRFKTKRGNTEKVSVLSFSKLVNGSKPNIKVEALDERRSYLERKRASRNRGNDRKRQRSRTPPLLSSKKSEISSSKSSLPDKDLAAKREQKLDKSPPKRKISLKKERLSPREKKFERKIEIKIKNPAKYEPGKLLKPQSDEGDNKVVVRKVELAKNVEDLPEDESETEIIVENDDSDEEDVTNVNEGDLRAQLSKKRAQRLHKHSPMDGVPPTRLLQNALQGAVFKKKTKKKTVTEQDNDGKLPIHLRLGIANNSDIFTDTKVRKKSRKHKTRLEQCK